MADWVEDYPVPTLFEVAAHCVSKHLDKFHKDCVSGLPVTVLSALVEYISAQHLDQYDDVFLKNGIDVSRAWKAHLMKRWPHRYQYRPPIFPSQEPASSKLNYLQNHFQDCLKAFLAKSAFDPSTPLRQPLRNEPAFLAKPVIPSILVEDVERYAVYAKSVVTGCASCHIILAQTNILKNLRKCTLSLETFLPHNGNSSAEAVDDFIKLLRDLKQNGCLEVIQLHLSGVRSDQSLIKVMRECAGQNARSAPGNLRSKLPFVLGIRSSPTGNSVVGSGSSPTEADLYDEAISTLSSRKSEKEFEQLLEAAKQRNVSDDNPENVTAHAECSKPEESSEGKQLKGFACYGVHCCGETAREMAYILMTWEKLERLAIHYFGGAGSSLLVAEENDPDFALLCHVLLHKVREHQLTQLSLIEHAVQPGPLLAVVRFYTALVDILNHHYVVSANQGRPFEFLRWPIVCTMEDTELFAGKLINQPVMAAEELKFILDPGYVQNRDTSARCTAAFVTSFIRFDRALTHLRIKDSAGYMFRFSDQDIVTICSAVSENKRITYFDLDVNVSSQVAFAAILDMIGHSPNLMTVNLMRLSVDWEDEEVKALQEKLISVIRNHPNLTSLTLKGRLARALHGRFLLDFVVGLFQRPDLPKLTHLDIGETGLTTQDLFSLASELKQCPCASKFPVLEVLSVRNTVKNQNVSLKMLSQLRRELKNIAFNVEITFEEMFGYQAEMMAMA